MWPEEPEYATSQQEVMYGSQSEHTQPPGTVNIATFTWCNIHTFTMRIFREHYGFTENWNPVTTSASVPFLLILLLCPSIQSPLSSPMPMHFIAILLPSARCPQTFLLSFQILPLPSRLQSPHSPHLSIPAQLPTCTSFPHQPLIHIYTSPVPLLHHLIAKVAKCGITLFSSLSYLHSVICCLLVFGLWFFGLPPWNCLPV